MKLELHIPALPKLPNTLLGAHWRSRASNAQKWKKLVVQSLFDCATSLPSHPLKKARIYLIRRSPRQCDFDGLVGSFKPVLDALVKCMVIEDDAPQHIECTYSWEKTSTKGQGIKVTIESIPEI